MRRFEGLALLMGLLPATVLAAPICAFVVDSSLPASSPATCDRVMAGTGWMTSGASGDKAPGRQVGDRRSSGGWAREPSGQPAVDPETSSGLVLASFRSRPDDGAMTVAGPAASALPAGGSTLQPYVLPLRATSQGGWTLGAGTGPGPGWSGMLPDPSPPSEPIKAALLGLGLIGLASWRHRQAR